MTSKVSIEAKKAAKDAGEVHYFTGRPCKRGHIAPRFVSGGHCSLCLRDQAGEWRKANPEKALQINRDSYYKNQDAYREIRAEKQPKNRALKAYHQALRRARLKQAAPKWLTKVHKDEMKALYFRAWEMSQTGPQQFTVDHVIPLKGKTVCGLHVPWNLEIITDTANSAKRNSFTE